MNRRGVKRSFTLVELPVVRKRAFTLVELPVVSKKAFTLVELLIVIAIIGIISVFIVLSVRSGQSRARDTKRVADLEAIDSAINRYYRETGHYPSLPENCGTDSLTAAGWINGVSSDLVTRWASGYCLAEEGGIVRENYFIKDLVPKYLPKLPVDGGPQVYQDGKAVRGFVYFHSSVNPQNIECYKIMALNPENPTLSQYKSIWDPMRQGANGDWAWSKYSRGCAAK